MQRSNRARTTNGGLYSLDINGFKIPYKKSVRFQGYYVQPNLKHNELSFIAEH